MRLPFAISTLRATAAILAVALGIGLASCSSPESPDATDIEANNFTQSDTSGANVTLADYRGKVVLVQFWATWCGPCLAHTPIVKELWSKYRGEEFQIIGVSLDYDLQSWRRYIRDNELEWLHCSDGRYYDNAVARQFNIRSTPSFILFAKNGKRIGNFFRFDELDGQIDAQLKAD